jgi:hypothetical protein
MFNEFLPMFRATIVLQISFDFLHWLPDLLTIFNLLRDFVDYIDEFFKPIHVLCNKIERGGAPEIVNGVPELSGDILRVKCTCFNFIGIVSEETENKAFQEKCHSLCILFIWVTGSGLL